MEVFKDNKTRDYPIKTDKTITVSYNGLRFIKFGFEFSGYIQKTTNKAGYDKL